MSDAVSLLLNVTVLRALFKASEYAAVNAKRAQ